MKNKILDELVRSGDVASYAYETIDENGEIVEKPSGNRNAECLNITFPSGKVVCFDTFCSGCSEDTFLKITAGG